MTHAVPFRLKRRKQPARVEGWWLPGTHAEPLMRLLAEVSTSWPEVYAVEGGHVVLHDGASNKRLAGAVPLRRLAGQLYLPADADLVPPLTGPEAVDLTAKRGLLFLPHGPVLAYDPEKPLKPGDLLRFDAIDNRDWQPFPEPPKLAATLTKLGFSGDAPPEAIIESGAPEPSDQPLEELRPPSAPFLTRLKEGMRMRAGKMLTSLGGLFKMPSLAKRGAQMIQKAVDKVPRLTEKIMDKQEAALRELLDRFRKGDVDNALRQAPIAVGDSSLPGRVDTSSSLGTFNPFYSLASLLGGAGGTVSRWLGGGDVWLQLAEEYRKAAEAAIQRGDYRRAAYIFGHLLRDFRRAAQVLSAGGLHRDAGILYREKVKDLHAAALCFEAAGDFDEAVRLYVLTEFYVQAGELYRKLHDEESALRMFLLEAERLARQKQHRAAGDFIRDRAGRSDYARTYYRDGWISDGTESAVCGTRLFDEYLVAKEWRLVRSLMEQAENRLSPPAPPADAARFFNHVHGYATGAWSDDLAEECRDRCRLALAGHLKAGQQEERKPTNLPGYLFGESKTWSPAVLRDASFAFNRKLPAKKEERGTQVQQLLPGPVTAVVQAKGSFDLIVGNEKGQVVCWRPTTGKVDAVATLPHLVTALAVDDEAKMVAAGYGDGFPLIVRTINRSLSENYRYLSERELMSARLLPNILAEDKRYVINVEMDSKPVLLHGPELTPVSHRYDFLDDDGNLFLFSSVREQFWIWKSSTLYLQDVDLDRVPRSAWKSVHILWEPDLERVDEYQVMPTIDWRHRDPCGMEVAGIDTQCNLHWSRVEIIGGSLKLEKSLSMHGIFRGVCLVRHGTLCGVTVKNELHWLRAEGNALKSWAGTMTLPNPSTAVGVYCIATLNEVAVLFEDGSLCRVPIPGS